MKSDDLISKLEDTDIAADVSGQGATGTGGKSDSKTDRPCHVYVATLRETGEAYVGITDRKVTVRWKEHCRNTIKSDCKFGVALRTYGQAAFDWEWIATFDCRKDAGEFERYCTDNKIVQLNSAPGGGGGDSWSSLPESKRKELLAERSRWFVTRETRQKMSQAAKGRPSPKKGIPVSEETRQKMSEAALGRKQSEEAKLKKSLALKGTKRSEETKQKVRDARALQVFSEETKLKMSCSRKGMEPWNKGKNTMTDEQKEHLRIINTGKVTSEETKLKISKALKGQQRESPTQEVRDRISATLMGNTPWNKGKDLSEAHCKALSLSHMGKKQSPEVIAKRTASRLATLARKKEHKLLVLAMGPVPAEVHLDG